MSALPHTSSASLGCSLVTVDGRSLPLQSTHVAAVAGAGLATVMLTQRFANAHSEPLKAIYKLPLPADGAVIDYAFIIAGRTIRGTVKAKADARAAFERALVEGRTAALLEETRSSLFRQELGNIPPGAFIDVTLTIEQPLAWVNQGWEWRFPTVVAPRYHGGHTPDPTAVNVPVAESPLPAGAWVSLTLSDALEGRATSPSHELTHTGTQLTANGALDRDIVVRWPVAAAQPGVSAVVHHGPDGRYARIVVVPPAIPTTPVNRDLIVLLDTSGSMGGAPLAQLKAHTLGLLGSLVVGDRFELLSFSSSVQRFAAGAVGVSPDTVAQAAAWVRGLTASGGTGMKDGIFAALAPLSGESMRQVVLMTDGLIGFESEILSTVLTKLPTGSRVHTVGIGHGVNRTLTAGVARAGRGVEVVVAPDEEPAQGVKALLAGTANPILTGLTVRGAGTTAPAATLDLYAGAPAVLHCELGQSEQIVLQARGPAGTWEHALALPAGDSVRAVQTRFARERVEDLTLAMAARVVTQAEGTAQITELGLRHRIATAHTSWVAIDTEVTVDAGAPSRTEEVPHELPHQMSAEGLGLRPASPPNVRPSPVRRTRSRGARSKMAPPAPKKKAAREDYFGGSLKEESLDGSFPEGASDAPVLEAQAGAPAEAAKAMREELSVGPIRVKARVIDLGDGRLAVVFQSVEGLRWEPTTSTLTLGESLLVVAEPGTTQAGTYPSGQEIRLVVRATGSFTKLTLRGPSGTLILELQ